MEELHDIVFNPNPISSELSEQNYESSDNISTTASSVKNDEDREESFKIVHVDSKESNKENKPPEDDKSNFDFNQVQSGQSKLEALRI